MTVDEFPPRFKGDAVYHYTDAAGLLGMVQNHTLRATEASGMNDPHEGVYGRKVVAEHVAPEPHREDFENHRLQADSIADEEVFVACATTRADDVSQWTRYTPWPSAGYCVGLDPQASLHVIRADPPVPYKASRTENGHFRIQFGNWASVSSWSPVVYGSQEFGKAMEDFYPWASDLFRGISTDGNWEDYQEERQMAESAGSTALNDMTRLAKHEGFAAENEIRLVATTSSGAGVVKYRPSRYGVVRYVDLGVGEEHQGYVVRDEEDATSWVRLPIVSVTISPSPFAERGVESVRRLLADNGYDIEPTVSTSNMR